MSSSSALQQHLSKLDTPGPVQYYAIAAIFDAACQRTGSSTFVPLSAPHEAAILQCLCLKNGHAVGVAAEKLIEYTRANKLEVNKAQSLLLTALAVASSSFAAPLTSTIVSLWHYQLSSTDLRTASRNIPWKAHTLSKALLASPFAGAELISSICRMLNKHAANDVGKGEENKTMETYSSLQFNDILSCLRPFLSFIFLDPMVSKQFSQHATNLHSSLVRTAAASTGCAPENQHAMLSMLCSFLPALQVQSTAQQLFAEACVVDIMDLLEACETEPGIPIIRELVEALISLCNDISNYGGSIAPFLTALASIFFYWPPAVLKTSIARREPICLQLTRLSVSSNASASDATAALSLLCSILLHKENKEEKPAAGWTEDDDQLHRHQQQQQQQQWLSAAISVQLVPGMAFGQLKSVKEWTSRALAAVNNRNKIHNNTDGAVSLLGMLWSNPTAARCWLYSLESELSLIESPSTSTIVSISPPTANIILSLIHHPEAVVARAAVDALLVAVRAAPLLGITALPVLIHKLHITVEKIGLLGEYRAPGGSSGGDGGEKSKNDKSASLYYQKEEALASLLPTLYALPQLAIHPSAVAFTVRALQPLLAPPAPDFLQGIALRMLCQMWLTTGRGFPHLRTALLSYSAPAGGRVASISPHIQAEDPALRRAWAASLADVCSRNGDRAKDLIHSITECLETSAQKGFVASEVQAAGLGCVAELCESDILDFYKAWRIVKPLVPTLPEHPVAAAAWLRLLASGGLDAAIYPEVSRGIFNTLWTTAQRHPIAFVRAQACSSLTAYDFLVLEENEILTQEMWEFAALLKDNTISSDNNNNSEELVVHVLQYEHTIRRRQQHQQRGALPGKVSKIDGGARGRFPWSNRTRSAALPGAGSSAQGVMHKLVTVFPKALLGGGSRDPKEFLSRIPDITPVAVLLLWSPPPPPASLQHASAAGNKSAAKHAVAGYAAVFSEVCKQSDAGFTGCCSGVYSNTNNDILAAWASFIKRWVSAAKDAAAVGAGGSTGGLSERTASGAQAVWQVIKAALDSGNTGSSSSSTNVTIGSNAACAAAALASSVHPQPVKPIVEQVFAALTQHAQQDVTGIYIQAAACTALGHCTDVVRSVLGLPALCTALGILQRHLANADAPPAVRAGSALGLSFAAKQLATKVTTSIQNVETVLKSIVTSLLSIAGSQFSEDFNQEILLAIESLVSGTNPVFSSCSSTLYSKANLPEEVFDHVLGGLAESISALLAVGLPPSLLCMLRTATITLLSVSLSISNTSTVTNSTSCSSSIAAVHGLCELLRAATLVGFKINVLTSNQVLETLELFKEMVLTGNPPNFIKNTSIGAPNRSGVAKNGKISGAAALALGSIIPSLLKEGFIFPSFPKASVNATTTTATTVSTNSSNSMSALNAISTPRGGVSPSYYLEILVNLAREGDVSKIMSSRAAAKQGAAGGIASVLQGIVHNQSGSEDSAGIVLSEAEKQALDVLEGLALKDEDRRARRGCARALSELCWSARQNGKSLQQLRDSAENTAGIINSSTNTSKGLASLPDNSALRYLCETIDSGSWPEIYEDEDKKGGDGDGTMVNENNDGRKEEHQIAEQSTLLTADQAAVVLHCLAAAPRLPVMDWSAACRRLLRTHQGSSAVQRAIVLLLSAHASVSQALQMYSFISEDVFGQPGFTGWQPEAQHAVLEELSRLLAALPDAEAISVLRMLCEKLCPDVSENTRINIRATMDAVDWQTALLQGLSTTAAAGVTTKKEESNVGNDDDAPKSVAQTAWECAMHAVLPKLPVPSTWPLNVKLSSLHHYILKDDKNSKTKLPVGAGTYTTHTSLNVRNRPSNVVHTMKPWVHLLECALTAPTLSSLENFFFSRETVSSREINFEKNPIHWTWLCAALLANKKNSIIGGGVDLRILQQPRNYIINNEIEDAAIIDVLILLVARALGESSSSSGGVTLAQKQQWIMDILQAAEKCTSPGAAVKLAAVSTVALATTATGGDDKDCFGKSHSLLVDCESAFCELPGSLRYLTESVEPCPVALVTSVVAALGTRAATTEEKTLSAGDEDGSKEKVKELQKECWWALRHALPAGTWVQVYTRVET